METTGHSPGPAWPRYARAGILIAWLLAVRVAYYAVHKPLDAVAVAGWQTTFTLFSEGWQLASLFETLVAGAAAAVVTCVILAVGAVPARLLTRGDCTAAEALALSGALGLGVLGTLTLGLSALRLLTAPAVAVIVMLLALIGTVHAARAGRWWKAEPAAPGLPRWLGATTLAFAALVICTASLRAAAPPTSWDALVYHLTGPKLWLQEGGLVYGLDLPHTYFPALMDHVYAAAMALADDRAAQLLHLTAAVWTLLITAALAERYVARGRGLVAAALLLSAPSLAALAGRAYVDWTLTLYCTAALWAALRQRAAPGAPGAVLTGVLCGLAASTKYTAAGPLLGILAVAASGPGPWTARARRSAIIVSVAAVVFLPWALRDLALTGNPVYPFVFGGWNWDAWRAEWFARPGTGLVQQPWRLVIVPWEATTQGAEYSLLYDGTIGPVFLTLLLPAILLLRQQAALRPLALFALAGYGVWLAGVAMSAHLLQVRLLYPVFPALAVLATAGLHSLTGWATPLLRPHRVAAAVLALDLGLVALGEIGRVGAETVMPVVVGAETRAQFHDRVLGEHARAVGGLANAAGASAKVLFLWEPRTYFCTVPCGPDALLFNFRDALRRAGGPPGVAAYWQEQGYTHVLLHGAGLRYFTTPPHVEMEPEHLAALLDVEQCCWERIYGPSVREALRGEGGRYTLFRLKDGS